MTSLDFSHLSDDQLISLIREALRECVARNPSVKAAAQSAFLDEQEKARIATAAAEAEAARLRALERERISKEATEKVRRATEDQRQEATAREAELAKIQAAEEGKKAATAAAAKEQEDKSWFRRAASLVDREPSKITICWLRTNYGCRVLINEGSDSQYAPKHLVDWNRDSSEIKTVRDLVGRKPELIAFCAEFAAAANGKARFLKACDYSWEVKSEPTN